MNSRIELEDIPVTQGFDSERYRLYEPASDLNREYPVSDYRIGTPRVPSMTIDDYIERLK